MKNIQRFILNFFQRKSVLYGLGIPLGTFILLNYIVLPLYVNERGTLIVPTVVGEPLESARHTLDSAGLQAIEAETRPDPTYPSGVVVMQNPLPDAVVKQGRRVYLTVSGGEIQMVVPSLRGRTTRDAKFALERFGLRLGGIGYTTSETFPENTIVDQSVASGSQVARGTVVNIMVSRGKALSDTTAPPLTGKTLTEAEKILGGLGLKVGNITYQPSFELLPNTVVEQMPRAGEPVHQGQGIDLFVVKAGKPSEEIQPPR